MVAITSAVVVWLRILCITLARLWQSARDGLQGVFLQPIAQLLARKTTQQTARVRLTTDRRELCRGSLTEVSRKRLARLGIGKGGDPSNHRDRNMRCENIPPSKPTARKTLKKVRDKVAA